MCSVLGDARLLLIKKVAVFSTKAFKTLKYCSIHNPARDVWCISEEYERRDGLVTWAPLDESYTRICSNGDFNSDGDGDDDDKKFGDIYQILGFDHRVIENDTSSEDNIIDIDDDYGAPDPSLECSQDWYS